jgi:hypothetical protein
MKRLTLFLHSSACNRMMALKNAVTEVFVVKLSYMRNYLGERERRNKREDGTGRSELRDYQPSIIKPNGL